MYLLARPPTWLVSRLLAVLLIGCSGVIITVMRTAANAIQPVAEGGGEVDPVSFGAALWDSWTFVADPGTHAETEGCVHMAEAERRRRGGGEPKTNPGGFELGRERKTTKRVP